MNIIIDETSKNVTINNSEIIIYGMKDKEILITGKFSMKNPYLADCLRMLIVEENSNLEIDSCTKIKISINYRLYMKSYYSELNMYNEYVKYKPKNGHEWYRFPHSFTLRENDKLIIKLDATITDKMS